MNIKRKLLSVCLAGIMALTVLPLSAFADGEAAETPPLDAGGYYLLDSAEDLYWFSDFVNSRTSSSEVVNARLEADIDLNPGISFAYNHETGKITVSKNNGENFHLGSGLKGTTLGAIDDGETAFKLNKWTPIGKLGKAYAGTFDGNGHTVNGVYVNDENIGFAGFFGLIGDINANNSYSGHVKSLTIGENSLILGYKCGGSGSTGGIAGMVMGIDSLTDCTNRAVVAGTSILPGSTSYTQKVGMVGGIAGCMAGSAEGCTNYGAVVSNTCAGGIIGNLTGGRTNTYAQADVLIRFCRNYGAVSADEQGGFAGGIAGNSGGYDKAGEDGGTIDACINFGRIRAYGAAGVVYRARRNATVKYCANRADVTATQAAGLVGYIDIGGAFLESSYNAAEIHAVESGSEPAAAYPLVYKIYTYWTGSIESCTVRKCYNDSTVHPCEDSALAGVSIKLTDCYNVPTETFAGGEPAYKMISGYEYRWKQNLPLPHEEGKIPQTYPDNIGARIVYQNTHYCCHTDSVDKEAHKAFFYSNQTGDITDEHVIGSNGLCTHCGIDKRVPNIVPEALPEATTREFYDVYIKTEGTPTADLTFDIVTGPENDTPPALPSWLNTDKRSNYLNLYGRPYDAGIFTFTVKATNTNGSSYKTYTLKVNENPIEEFAITTSHLPCANVGEKYTVQLTTNSKDPKMSISWEMMKGSVLPDGLIFNEKSGVISGTPTKAGLFTLEIMAIRGNGKDVDYANKTLILNVYDSMPPVYENAIVYDGRTVFITCAETGTYTVVFANCDKSGKLSEVKHVTRMLAQGYNTVDIPAGMQMSEGSSVFFWESFETMKPMCPAFTIGDMKK